jgi:hypothetical protein
MRLPALSAVLPAFILVRNSLGGSAESRQKIDEHVMMRPQI